VRDAVPPSLASPPTPSPPLVAGVLASFIESFPIVGQLAQQSETEVFEGYLRQRWRDAPRALGPEPRGPHAVALCRLIVQAQHEAAQKGVFEAFWRLQEADRAVRDSRERAEREPRER